MDDICSTPPGSFEAPSERYLRIIHPGVKRSIYPFYWQDMDDSVWGHWLPCQAFDIPISCRMLLIYTFGGIAVAVINSLLPAPLSGG